jgi:hypothetical protein
MVSVYVLLKSARWTVATRNSTTDWPAVVRHSSMAVTRLSICEWLKFHFSSADASPESTSTSSEMELGTGPSCDGSVPSR